MERLASPMTLGIAAGLFVGKQIGVFGAASLAVKLRWADLPAGASSAYLYGVAMLCGIGFTMSLFIGMLAFADMQSLQNEMKIGVLLGSLVSGAAGALVL